VEEFLGEDMLPLTIETVVVGAGQAGLVMSWFLRQAGRKHVVLERRDHLGGSWPDRWDEFRLVTPNWTTSLPGLEYDGPDPDGFMSRDEVVARVARYAEVVAAPVRLGTEVQRLTVLGQEGGGFRLDTNRGTIEASAVVVATGGSRVPKVPALAADLPSRVVQLHSHAYRSEATLPSGGVLVVGSGQSGVQIAEELHAAGRRVTLSVGRCGRVPRRYRGRDILWWLVQLATRGAEYGVPIPTVDTLPDPRLRFAGVPHLSGRDGGHETNLRRFAVQGIRLVGHLEEADGERVRFAPDLSENLRLADDFFDERLRKAIDTFIEGAGIDAPPDDRQPFAFEPPDVPELDLTAEEVATVIWATGYQLDFGWIDLPIFDDQGAPRHTRGVTEVEGLSFLGLPWQLDEASTSFFGAGRDAQHLADQW
jgi:putative flavoprotein involved in K+ transport